MVLPRFICAAALACGSVFEAYAAPLPAMDTPGPSVFAVESLRPALDAIAGAWIAKGGRPIALAYGSPAGMLMQPGGASLDVVITDEAKEMDALAKAGFIAPQTRRAIIGDDLVLIAPANATEALKIISGFDLARAIGDGRLALCAPASCSAGIQARHTLETLKVWSAVESKLTETADDRAVVATVARGEARFGIAFATDAKSDSRVRIVDRFPVSTYQAVAYAVALAKASASPEAASFIAYLRSGQATRILSGLGFTVLK